MRIGIVTKHLGLPVGLGTYARRLLAALSAVDGETSYFVYTPRAAAPDGLGTNFTSRPFPVPPGLRSALAAWEHAVVPRAACRDRVALLHYLHTACPLGPFTPPVIVNVLDTITWSVPGYALPPPYQWLASHAVRRAQRVMTISQTAKDEIQTLLGVDTDRISVSRLAGPPVDEEPVEKQPYLLFIGGTERRKNLRSVLEAFARGGFPGIRLVVVGPHEASPVNEDARQLLSGLSDEQRERVEWRGRVADDELTRLYREATALVFPSLHEGYGLPVVEAMARLTPVICSNRTSLPEIAKDGALLVDPLDVGALERAMKAIIGDEQLRNRLVRRGREIAAGYRWEDTAKRTRAVYEQVLEGRRPRP